MGLPASVRWMCTAVPQLPSRPTDISSTRTAAASSAAVDTAASSTAASSLISIPDLSAVINIFHFISPDEAAAAATVESGIATIDPTGHRSGRSPPTDGRALTTALQSNHIRAMAPRRWRRRPGPHPAPEPFSPSAPLRLSYQFDASVSGRPRCTTPRRHWLYCMTKRREDPCRRGDTVSVSEAPVWYSSGSSFLDGAYPCSAAAAAKHGYTRSALGGEGYLCLLLRPSLGNEEGVFASRPDLNINRIKCHFSGDISWWTNFVLEYCVTLFALRSIKLHFVMQFTYSMEACLTLRLIRLLGWTCTHNNISLAVPICMYPHWHQCSKPIFIHSGYFYSASSSPLLLRGVPDTARILCRNMTLNMTKHLVRFLTDSSTLLTTLPI